MTRVVEAPAEVVPAPARASGWRRILREQQLPLILLLAPCFLVSRWPIPLVGAGLIAALAALRWRATGHALTPGRAGWPLVGLLAMTAVGLLVSLAPDLSLGPGLLIAYGAVLACAVVGSVEDLRAARALAGGLVLGAAALVPIALLGTDWTDKSLTYLPAAIYAPLPQVLGAFATTSYGTNPGGFNPNEVALALALLLPFPLLLGLLPPVALRAVAAGSRWRLILRRPVLFAVVGLGLALIVLTQSRATLVALALVLGGGALARSPRVRAHGRLLAGLAGAALVAAALLVWLTPALYTRLTNLSGAGWGSGGRLLIWARALPMIADFPLTGIGLNTFPVIQPLLYPAFALRGGSWVHAHNLYLQTALDLGLPGLLALLALVATALRGLRAAVRTARPAPLVRALATATAAALAIWLVAGLVDSPVRLGNKTGLEVWLLLGLACALPALAAPPAPGDPAADPA